MFRHRKWISIVVAVCLFVATASPGLAATGATTAAPTCTADSENKDTGIEESTETIVEGLLDQAAYVVTSATPLGGEPDAAASAQWFQTAFNSRKQSFVAYANTRTSATKALDVVAIRFQQDGESESVYIVATVADSQYETAHIVDSTQRPIDESVTVRGYAAANAANELAAFHDHYVITDKEPGTAYVTCLAVKYGGSVDSTLFDDRQIRRLTLN